MHHDAPASVEAPSSAPLIVVFALFGLALAGMVTHAAAEPSKCAAPLATGIDKTIRIDGRAELCWSSSPWWCPPLVDRDGILARPQPWCRPLRPRDAAAGPRRAMRGSADLRKPGKKASASAPACRPA